MTIQTEYYPYNLIIAIFGVNKDSAEINKTAFELNLKRVAMYAQVSDRDVESLIWRYRDGLSYQAIAKRYDNTVTRQALQMAQHTALNKLNKEEYFDEFFRSVDNQPVVLCGDNLKTEQELTPADTSISAFNFSTKTKSALRRAGFATIGDVAKSNIRDIISLPHVHWRNSESIFKAMSKLEIARPSPEVLDGIDSFVKKYKMSSENFLETVKYVITKKSEAQNSAAEVGDENEKQ